MQAVFTGFDSAWGADNTGAICDLVLLEDGSLHLTSEPARANWASALVRARQDIHADPHVWAIDQPLLVANLTGCRPVERDLASALMADFHCGAHSSNLGMPAWGAPPVWNLRRVLDEKGYIHDPMGIPEATSGRFYFECYPHAASSGILRSVPEL